MKAKIWNSRAARWACNAGLALFCALVAIGLATISLAAMVIIAAIDSWKWLRECVTATAEGIIEDVADCWREHRR